MASFETFMSKDPSNELDVRSILFNKNSAYLSVKLLQYLRKILHKKFYK